MSCSIERHNPGTRINLILQFTPLPSLHGYYDLIWFDDKNEYSLCISTNRFAAFRWSTIVHIIKNTWKTQGSVHLWILLKKSNVSFGEYVLKMIICERVAISFRRTINITDTHLIKPNVNK